MILADTSLWIDYFRAGDIMLRLALQEQQIRMHPLVFGELVCGNLPKRRQTIEFLGELRPAVMLPNADVLRLVESRRLYGSGLGWVDIHLLASALIGRLQLWTFDKRLDQAARRLGISTLPSA